MDGEPQIVFEDFAPTDSIKFYINEHLGKLLDLQSQIKTARVVVSKPHKHQSKGERYVVNIHLSLPAGQEVIVSHEPGNLDAHGDVYVTLRDAFNAAKRQLQDRMRKMEGAVKNHKPQPEGKVLRLIDGEDYGFLESPGGREIYFHRNAVDGGKFDDLKAGDVVRYAEDERDDGVYATFVKMK